MSAKPQRHKGSKARQRKGSLATSPNPNREPKISIQQRINPVYLKEESQIQKLIEPREEKLRENTQTDLEVQFFTESLQISAEDEKDKDASDDLSLQSTEFQSAQPHFLDSIVQIEEDKLFERVKEKVELNPSVLYHPSSEKPSIPNVESSEETNLGSQGIYEAPLNQNINEKNKNLLYNRLLEEDKYHLFNRNGELIGLEEEIHRNKKHLMRFESTKEFPVKFILLTADQLNSTEQLQESSVLVIKIGRLLFRHHHLFSEEEFLVKAIEKSFQEYSQAKKSGASEKLKQRIAFQKTAMEEMKKDSEVYKSHLKDILELRSKYHLERKGHIERIQNILHDYKTLKQLRKTQQFNSTTLKLTISMDESLSKDQGRFSEDLLEEEIRETFELECIEYQELKRDRKRRKSLSPEEQDNLLAMPQKPNLDKIKSKLRRKFKDCHFDLEGHAGVEILKAEIPKTDPLSNVLEKKRINSVLGLKFHLKVFCNNEPVGVINSNTMDEEFEINFNSSISLRLTNRLPDQIRIDLVEQRPLKGKLKITKISVPVPRIQQGNIDSCDYSHLEFTSQKSVQSDVGIGAGQFCIRKNQQVCICGSLAVKIGWKEAGKGFPEMPIPRLTRITSRDSQIDPMNPDLDYKELQSTKGPQVIEKDDEEEQEEEAEEEFHFNEDELAFCSLEEFKDNRRNRILSERAKNNLKYKDYKLVPFNERQLEEDTEEHEKILDETLGMDPIDLQRFKGKKYLIDVYSKISNYCKSLSEECDENHLLMENMPTLASLVTRFFELFGPNRPLKPVRRQGAGVHRLSSRNVEVSQFKISLNIVRAFGVPQRQDEGQLSTRKSSNMSSPKDSGYRPINIRPFVTATFKETSVRTSTGDGSNPTWNEQMSIPLE